MADGLMELKVKGLSFSHRASEIGKSRLGKPYLTAVGNWQRIVLLFLISACACARPLCAHPVSITEATVYVQREKVTAKIDVYVEDLYLFHSLKPNQQNRIEPPDIERAKEAHSSFLLERFVVRDAAGEALKGRVVKIDGFEMPVDGISLDDLMSYSYSYNIEYEIVAPLEFITLSQHLVDEGKGIPAEMQVRVKQEGSDNTYAGMLTGAEPITIRFNWEHPPLSPDASAEEWDKWLNQRREETLGITSYSSVYSFIYITDKEVRHEILVPLATLESSVLIPRRDMAFLEIDEQPEAATQIGEFFRAGNPVTINGQPVAATIHRIDFYGVDFRDFAQQAPKRRVSMASARAGIILSYPAQSPPENVKVQWNRWNKYIWTVRSVIYAYEQTEQATFSRYGKVSEYQWTSPGRSPLPEIEAIRLQSAAARLDIPVASLTALLSAPLAAACLWLAGVSRKMRLVAVVICALLAAVLWPTGHVVVRDPFAQAVTLDQQTANHVFSTLHGNMYRAFDFQSEEDTYEALARSVDGPLLQNLYLQIRRGLAMQEQGGAISTISEVKIVDGQPVIPSNLKPDTGFEYRCRWTVKGTVEHWGHIHARTNEYEATFRVAARDQTWKITAVELTGEKRLDFETELRS